MAAYSRWTRESRKLVFFISFQGKDKLISVQPVNQTLSDVPRSCFSTAMQSFAEDGDEEVVMRKRNKSNMRDDMRRLIDRNPTMPKIRYDYQQHQRYRSRLYMKFGRESGINPGSMWPSMEKVQEIIEHEKEFEPDFKEMVAEVEQTQQFEKESIIAREKEIDRNMASLDKWMSDLHGRKQKALNEILAQQEKKERLIEEVRQYFGYRLLPKDPKFQEILEKKEKEEKKALKEAKKKERFAKEMARLANLAQAGMSTTPATPQSESPNQSTGAPPAEDSIKQK